MSIDYTLHDVCMHEGNRLLEEREDIVNQVRQEIPSKPRDDSISSVSFEYVLESSLLQITIQRGKAMKPINKAGKISDYDQQFIERLYEVLEQRLEYISLMECD